MATAGVRRAAAAAVLVVALAGMPGCTGRGGGGPRPGALAAPGALPLAVLAGPGAEGWLRLERARAWPSVWPRSTSW